mmetsp:Transcript_11991/g.23863  ORF Transcript_11991/g.23863 Transcript_11991/m.23863 type:complete len:213 (-) Transcript_11991:25-663(-)
MDLPSPSSSSPSPQHSPHDDSNLVALTQEEASRSAGQNGENVYRPPIDLPDWLCVFLPCLSSLPSMVAFRETQTDTALLYREFPRGFPGVSGGAGWVAYDADAVVVGDTCKVECGMIAPADMTVLDTSETSAIVDASKLTGQPSLGVSPNSTLLAGCTVKSGGPVVGRVTHVGRSTVLARLIKDGKFPCTSEMLEQASLLRSADGMDEEKGL